MRLIFLTALGAVLSLEASAAAIPNVICDPRPAIEINSTITRPSGVPDLGHCIKDICESGGNAGSLTKSCGLIALTITHLGAPLSSIEDCINGFHDISDKCSTSAVVHGGVLGKAGVMYDVSAVDLHGEEDHYPARQARRSGQHMRIRKVSSKTTKKGRKKTLKKPKTTKPKTTKPKTTKPKTEKSKSCARPKKSGQKDKGKKTIRNLAESFLAEVLSSTILPRTPAGSRPGSSIGSRPGSSSGSQSDGCDGAYFQKRELQQNKVEWFSFHKEDDDWEKTLGPSHQSRNVLARMPKHSKFDAVKLHRGNMQVVGDPKTSTAPDKWPVGTGSYLFTNGGFFAMEEHPKDDKPVGPTSLRPDYEPIPEDYKEYYKELRDGDQFLWAGPSLKTSLPLYEPQFVYGFSQASGSLDHAGSSNERLAVAFVGQDKYVFTHMANDRFKDGVNANQLRTLIDEFLKAFGGAGASISHASTVLNLDGGGSIWMSWREGGRDKHIIARGDGKDDGPPFGSTEFRRSPREVVNFLKWSSG